MKTYIYVLTEKLKNRKETLDKLKNMKEMKVTCPYSTGYDYQIGYFEGLIRAMEATISALSSFNCCTLCNKVTEEYEKSSIN